MVCTDYILLFVVPLGSILLGFCLLYLLRRWADGISSSDQSREQKKKDK